MQPQLLSLETCLEKQWNDMEDNWIYFLLKPNSKIGVGSQIASKWIEHTRTCKNKNDNQNCSNEPNNGSGKVQQQEQFEYIHGQYCPFRTVPGYPLLEIDFQVQDLQLF